MATIEPGSWIEVVPAYGRDYKNQKEVKEAWSSGLDFQETATRSYISIGEANRMGLKTIVRYSKLQKVVDVSKVTTPKH